MPGGDTEEPPIKRVLPEWYPACQWCGVLSDEAGVETMFDFPTFYEPNVCAKCRSWFWMLSTDAQRKFLNQHSPVTAGYWLD